MIFFKNKRPKFAVVLGSGGAKGISHIGVLKALENNNIPIDIITGTSIGALIGAIYASGNLEKLINFLTDFKKKNLLEYLDFNIIPKKGFIKGKKIIQLLYEFISLKDLKDSNIKLGFVATDLTKGEPYYFTEGDVISAVRSSISIPGIFDPYRYNNKILVDGAVVDPLPVKLAKKLGADIILAVDLSYYNVEAKHKEFSKNKDYDSLDFNIFEVLILSLESLERQIAQEIIKNNKIDFLIRPEVGHIHTFDFHKGSYMIENGYKKTKPIIPFLKTKLFLKKYI